MNQKFIGNCGICDHVGTEWMQTKEAEIIKPDRYYLYWWDIKSMGSNPSSQEARAARLMGIAIMLTMPSEIINHECKP